MTLLRFVRVPKSPPPIRALALGVLWLIASWASGAAATRKWSGLPFNSYWSEGNNWEPNFPPNPGDELVFSISYFQEPMVNDLAAGIFIHSITFDFNGYTLVGNAITLTNIGCTDSDIHPSNTIEVPILAPIPLQIYAAAGCSLIFDGEISGAGHPVVGGVGPVILSGGHSYTGPTETSHAGGYLVVNGTLSGTSEVNVHASSGTSTLGGSGNFNAPLTVEALSPVAFAVVAPGQPSATGILSTGSATFGLNASLAIRLNGVTPGTEYDQLSVGGEVDLGNSATLDVTSLGFIPAIGTTFTILQNIGGSPISGQFVDLPESGVFVKDATTFQISYVGGGGHDVVLTVVPTVVTAAAPAALAVDSGGNGVLEAGELASMQPTWTNTSGDSLHLVGATANFTGPAGALYDNPDASGDYGTIADGFPAQCADCYAVQITASSRPAPHWDATIEETVTPGFLTKIWTLHVGESFQDVPSVDPFYASIENLFHNGVTGGCGSDAYCPSNPATRGQMAVFLLKGEHGGSFAPPACAATVFTDVPCPGGEFVDWVNQLASESITAGCGGGRYCPADPINRGQMAAFLVKTFALVLYGL